MNTTCTAIAFRASAFVACASMAMAQSPAGPRHPARNLQPVGQLPAPDPSPAPVPFCFGDGTQAACPCDNTGAPGRGCDNSSFSGGAILWATGHSRFSADTAQLHVLGEPETALSVVLQGDAAVRPAPFGDGVRCIGGTLTRLYVQNAVGGMLTVPEAGQRSLQARSASLGDPIVSGDVRYYQVYYRDPLARFCGAPQGGAFNVSNGVALTWIK